MWGGAVLAQHPLSLCCVSGWSVLSPLSSSPGPHYQILPSLLVSPALSFLGCDLSSLPFIVVIVDSWFLMRLSCGLPSFSTSEVDLAWCFLGAGLLKKIKNDLFPSPMHMT